MAKITIEKKYYHDYSNPTEENKYNIEHDKSGSLETIEVDSVEELLKRVLNEYTSQDYTIRTFDIRLEKGYKNMTDEGWDANEEMVKIHVKAVK